MKRPSDTLGGLPKLLDVELGDAAPRLGSLVPTEIDLGITEVDAISNGVVMPIAQYPSPVVVNVLAAQDHPRGVGVGLVWGGKYQQVRFVIDVASSKVVANGANYPITFPGNAAAGTTVNSTGSTTTQILGSGSVAMSVSGNFMLGLSPAAAIEADFNAFESLKVNSYGDIIARPALFAVPSALSGKVSGSIANRNGAPVSGATIVAFDANNRVANTDNTNADGTFNMHTLAAGSYHLVVYNGYKTAAGQTIYAANESYSAPSVVDGGYVTVSAGQTTNVPAIND